MPNKPIAYRIVQKKLEKLGFSIISQKGSHVKFIKYLSYGTLTAIVPKHKEITIGTLKSILKQGNISEQEFNDA